MATMIMMNAATKATARMSVTVTPVTVPVELMAVSPLPVTEYSETNIKTDAIVVNHLFKLLLNGDINRKTIGVINNVNVLEKSFLLQDEKTHSLYFFLLCMLIERKRRRGRQNNNRLLIYPRL